jgi:hypothetical protein
MHVIKRQNPPRKTVPLKGDFQKYRFIEDSLTQDGLHVCLEALLERVWKDEDRDLHALLTPLRTSFLILLLFLPSC